MKSNRYVSFVAVVAGIIVVVVVVLVVRPMVAAAVGFSSWSQLFCLQITKQQKQQ